jgi:AcrR family transcriptional regulator
MKAEWTLRFWHTVKVTPQAAPEKSLRSDARRNRERLVASARELFAQSGVEVSVEEITHHAGLGMGTLYRHFPTKDDLIDAVLEDSFAELIAFAQEGVAALDPWAAFTDFLERSLALHASNRGLKDVLASGERGRERAESMRSRIRPLLRTMIERAQSQGTLRADFTAEDLPLLFWTSNRVIEMTSAIAPDYWRRHLGLLLDGMRAPAATPLPVPPLTRVQLGQAAKRRGA